jgi:hypothetical protein
VCVHGGLTVFCRLAQPHFVQDKYILMGQCTRARRMLHAHMPSDEISKPIVLHVSRSTKYHGIAVTDITGSVNQTFSFVETMEPLSCYVQESINV